MEKTISLKTAKELKPKKMPSIEKELQYPSPRPFLWAAKINSSKRLTEKDKILLSEGHAVKAWVVIYDVETDLDHSHHFITYAYEFENKIYQSRIFRSYDEYQLMYSYPEYSSWMYDSYRKGGTFTILLDTNNPGVHIIYGEMHLFLKSSLVSISKQMIQESNHENYINLSEQFLRIVLSPLGKLNKEWKDYYRIMDKFGLLKDGEIRNTEDNLQKIQEIFSKNVFKKEDLNDLSDICLKYSPGIWAAR